MGKQTCWELDQTSFYDIDSIERILSEFERYPNEDYTLLDKIVSERKDIEKIFRFFETESNEIAKEFTKEYILDGVSWSYDESGEIRQMIHLKKRFSLIELPDEKYSQVLELRFRRSTYPQQSVIGFAYRPFGEKYSDIFGDCSFEESYLSLIPKNTKEFREELKEEYNTYIKSKKEEATNTKKLLSGLILNI